MTWVRFWFFSNQEYGFLSWIGSNLMAWRWEAEVFHPKEAKAMIQESHSQKGKREQLTWSVERGRKIWEEKNSYLHAIVSTSTFCSCLCIPQSESIFQGDSEEKAQGTDTKKKHVKENPRSSNQLGKLMLDVLALQSNHCTIIFMKKKMSHLHSTYGKSW
jgi:hypothetical protein